ncbi:hypothetical protein JHW43_002213 [Diplocarpon mali]|nr:hypothetical protein JHW43_002213 [Diplocarpon mali]
MFCSRPDLTSSRDGGWRSDVPLETPPTPIVLRMRLYRSEEKLFAGSGSSSGTPNPPRSSYLRLDCGWRATSHLDSAPHIEESKHVFIHPPSLYPRVSASTGFELESTAPNPKLPPTPRLAPTVSGGDGSEKRPQPSGPAGSRRRTMQRPRSQGQRLARARGGTGDRAERQHGGRTSRLAPLAPLRLEKTPTELCAHPSGHCSDRPKGRRDPTRATEGEKPNCIPTALPETTAAGPTTRSSCLLPVSPITAVESLFPRSDARIRDPWSRGRLHGKWRVGNTVTPAEKAYWPEYTQRTRVRPESFRESFLEAARVCRLE